MSVWRGAHNLKRTEKMDEWGLSQKKRQVI